MGFLSELRLRLLLGVVGAGSIALCLFLGWQLGAAHGRIAKLKGQRDAAVKVGETLIAWGDATCQSVGEVFRPDDEPDAANWGQACRDKVRGLVQFKADAIEASAKAMQDAIAEQQRKSAVDLAKAQRAAAQARALRQRMGDANARISNDEVGGDWFAHLNALGGLRPPLGASANGDLSAGAADPAERPADLPSPG